MTAASLLATAALAVGIAAGSWTAGQVYVMAAPARAAAPPPQAQTRRWLPVAAYVQGLAAEQEHRRKAR